MQKDMTVGDLKRILMDISDDTPVIIPVITEDDANNILGFRYVRTAGLLENDYEEKNPALCLNTTNNDVSIKDQLKSHDTICKKVLF